MADQHPIEEAKALIYKGAMGEAINKLSFFLNGDFWNAEALFMLGSALMSQGQNGVGAVLTSAAIDAVASKGQNFPEAMTNLGAAYKAEHQNEAALKVWLDALKCERLPTERAKIMTNISGLFVNAGCPEKAIPWCERALQEDPNAWGAQTNRGMAYLEMGRWREGWNGFAYTYLTGDRQRRVYKDLIEWDGRPGRKVIVFGDQGIGDEIYFANCLPDLIGVSERVILDCHPRLTKLFERSFPQVEVHGTRKHLSDLDWVPACDADCVIGLADLPKFFRNETADWNGKPYLTASGPSIVVGAKYTPRIGISWTGGSKRTHQELRSLPLEALAPIIQARPDAQWFSLQYTPNAAREVCELEERTGIRVAHYPGWVECFDYDRTASFVASLDLVITVCTTVHHVGGAMGIPTWTLVPYGCSWRYGGGQDTLPWYGSVRLFRQDKDGEWSAPIERIVTELEKFRC